MSELNEPKRLPDEILKPCLEILEKQFIKTVNTVDALQTLQSELFTGEEAVIRRPSDVNKGAALRVIAKAQVDRVLASHTYARLRSVLEEYDKKEKAEKRKTYRKVKKPVEAPPALDGPAGASNAVVTIYEGHDVEVPMALVMAVGINKKAALSVVAAIYDAPYSLEGLQDKSSSGKLVAAESTIMRVLKSLVDPEGPLKDAPFELEELEGVYRIVSRL